MKRINCNICAVFMVFALFAGNLYSQDYFGRNKIQYRNFNFSILKTKNFDIYYYPEEKAATYDAAEILERWRSRYTRLFGDSLKKDQPVILYSTHADFEQTNVVEGFLSQATGGVTEGIKNRITIPFAGDYADNNHVLGHELVHAFQYDLIRSRKNGFKEAESFPLWFIEGMAEYFSIGRKDGLTSMWLRDAVLHNDVPSIDDVGRNAKYFPYRYGQAILAYIGSRWGDDKIPELLKNALQFGWDGAFKKTIGINLDTLSIDWKKAVTEEYKGELNGRNNPDSLGYTISAGEDAINLSPVISPDGKYIAVIARHDLFTLDLYLIDAHTGEIYKKLVSSNSDAHFDDLQFINSSGSWSPDGKLFAFVVVKNGENAISIVDVSSGNIKETFSLKKVDGIFHLAWSPDGKQLAISGTYGGINNLYLYNFDNKNLEQLTNDKYAELQPAWSPDGETLAYVTDQGGSTNLSSYIFGPMRIGLLNMKTRAIRYLSMGEDAKLINPQFSPDGESVYFISDPDGISNIYRYSFDKNEFYRVTNVSTGISGLTSLSPAISVAQKTGRLVFDVFDNASYDVRGLSPENVEGEKFDSSGKEFENVVSLPLKSKASDGIVENYLSDDTTGFIAENEINQKEYNPSLSLYNIGQASIGVGNDMFGTYVGGSISMLFSDMLGNHLLSGVVQANGEFKDIGGAVSYFNRSNRINWGASIGHIPYLSGYFGQKLDTVTIQGQQYLANDFIFYKQRVYNNQVSLLGEYPLSTNRRLEFGIGFQNIGFGLEADHAVTVGNYLVNSYTETLDSPPSLNIFQTDLAYVGDYSFMAFTSPVDGSRYRFEIQPSIGSLKFYSLTADVRKYFFFSPFTLAFRALHYGRYGEDSEDNRLYPLSIGYETLVRGYDLNSISQSECSGDGLNGCPVFDRLIGSRIAVFNMEFRVPLFGNEQFGLINFPYLPTELSLFLDGGVAWSSASQPVFDITSRSNERIPVFSAGVAARFNLFGYIIGQIYYADAFQRPDNRYQFGFVISPGW
jgi:WD40 repeat protein